MPGQDGGLMSQRDWRLCHRGMMRVLASTSSVPAGVVSLAVTNTGYLTHERVVLPLAAGQQPGTRPVGGDGKVDESGSCPPITPPACAPNSMRADDLVL